MFDKNLADFIDAVLAEGPRRFAAIGIAPDRTDAGLIGWGMAFEDEAVFVTGGSGVVRAASAESIGRMLSRRGEVRLAWLDPSRSAGG